MIIHDKYIDIVNATLFGRGTNIKVLKEVKWKNLDKSEFLLDSETAVELGTTNLQSLSMSLFTTSKIFKDKIVVVGTAIDKLSGKNPYFAKIVFVKLKSQTDENKVYTSIKEVSRTRFHLNLEGTMTRGTAIENKECIRISSSALKKGFNFSILGSALIKKIKEHEQVENVQVYYIVNDNKLIDKFRYIPEETTRITGAFNHIFDGLQVDCVSCIIKDVCDEVDGMRENHMNKISNRFVS